MMISLNVSYRFNPTASLIHHYLIKLVSSCDYNDYSRLPRLVALLFSILGALG